MQPLLPIIRPALNRLQPPSQTQPLLLLLLLLSHILPFSAQRPEDSLNVCQFGLLLNEQLTSSISDNSLLVCPELC